MARKKKQSKWDFSRVEMVEWDDSCSNGRWHEFKESTTLSKCATVGFLVHEDKHVVTIASSQDRATKSLHSSMTIPKSAITSRKTLEK